MTVMGYALVMGLGTQGVSGVLGIIAFVLYYSGSVCAH